MSKGTWACFDCREAVRRAAPPDLEVTCAFCGRPCRYIGHKIPTPRKSAVKQWEALRQSLADEKHRAADERVRNGVRLRHDLEQEIARLEAKPSNPGLTKAIRLLRRQLDGC